MVNAIFYRNMYLLLPEEFPDFDSFIRDLRSRELPAAYEMVVLREDHQARNFSVIKGVSMAPYFLSGYHDDPCIVPIANPDEVYPVQVEYLTQEEYNARLRGVINEVCPGCLRFKPLSNRVQSLNGHFQEMTLDGVCMFRQDTKPSPRILRERLFAFGGFFIRNHYENYEAADITKEIGYWIYLRCVNPVLVPEEGSKTLTLQCKKKELLAPLMVETLSRYLDKITHQTYHVRQEPAYTITEEEIAQLIAPENTELFRKECKKYGISLAVLEYDPDAAQQVRSSLEELAKHFWIFPLVQADGRDCYLLADTPCVLKELRYRAPLLQAHHAAVTVYDQFRNTRYQISFDMTKTIL